MRLWHMGNNLHQKGAMILTMVGSHEK